MMSKKKVGVILAGCGYLDGSEIQEVVLTLLSLDRAGISYEGISLNKGSYHAVNHITQENLQQNRNILEESARIMRGQIIDIEQANVSDYDGFIYPGGFGAAKNLFDFAIKYDASFSIDPSVFAFTKEAILLKKPVGFICISPMMIPKLYPEGVKMTIGDDINTSNIAIELGANHIKCAADEVCYDERYNVISTPAYMLDSNINKVSKGIDRLVKLLIDCMS